MMSLSLFLLMVFAYEPGRSIGLIIFKSSTQMCYKNLLERSVIEMEDSKSLWYACSVKQSPLESFESFCYEMLFSSQSRKKRSFVSSKISSQINSSIQAFIFDSFACLLYLFWPPSLLRFEFLISGDFCLDGRLLFSFSKSVFLEKKWQTANQSLTTTCAILTPSSACS